MTTLILKSFIIEPIIAILYFPVWWYSAGLIKKIKGLGRRVKILAHFLGLKILLVNLFKPMFGEYSRSGRIISFFMRCILLVWRMFLFVLGTLFFVLLFFVWIFLPLIAIWQIYTLINL